MSERVREARESAVSIDICGDCLQVIANGELWDEDGDDIAAAHSARIDAYLGEAEVTLGHLNENCEYCRDAYEEGGESSCDVGWFSMSRCDGCGSTLGGMRYAATIWFAAE